MFIPSLLIVAATAYKIGVISDPHYNPLYDPNGASDNNCTGPSSKSSDYAPLGRYGCDMGPDMFDILLTRF